MSLLLSCKADGSPAICSSKVLRSPSGRRFCESHLYVKVLRWFSLKFTLGILGFTNSVELLFTIYIFRFSGVDCWRIPAYRQFRIDYLIKNNTSKPYVSFTQLVQTLGDDLFSFPFIRSGHFAHIFSSLDSRFVDQVLLHEFLTNAVDVGAHLGRQYRFPDLTFCQNTTERPDKTSRASSSVPLLEITIFGHHPVVLL